MSGAQAVRALGAAWILLSLSDPAGAGDPGPAACFEDEVLHHVQQQFQIHGPRSSENEYFGFIYRKDGQLGSAVTRSINCRGAGNCVVNAAFARARIPKGAKVLGEWHTHPHMYGSDGLSTEDVRGAHDNRHVRCYSAFYSDPNGDIYRWDIEAATQPLAMASRAHIGNYRSTSSSARSANYRLASGLPGS